MKKHGGFTLVELVITMLLIAVLAVTVLPKLFGQSDFSSYTIRDQLIAQLRLVQLQALNRRGICHNLIVTNNQFGIVNNSDSSSCLGSSNIENGISLGNVSVSVGGNANLDFQFDSEGRVSNIATSAGCNGCVEINVIGSDSVKIIIESEGYIHGQ